MTMYTILDLLLEYTQYIRNLLGFVRLIIDQMQRKSECRFFTYTRQATEGINCILQEFGGKIQICLKIGENITNIFQRKNRHFAYDIRAAFSNK